MLGFGTQYPTQIGLELDGLSLRVHSALPTYWPLDFENPLCNPADFCLLLGVRGLHRSRRGGLCRGDCGQDHREGRRGGCRRGDTGQFNPLSSSGSVKLRN